MRYAHAALNPVASHRAVDLPRNNAAPARAASIRWRLFWKIVVSAFGAAVAIYLWRRR
ncbi:hypothetical protein V3H18_09055 [Methylocystis sp. 9N]|uniref:Uncharacterized protein n=1 Tax=Methylocystis borbori TaxID=3118750 RepID=A0ABU7XHL1_9HYPH